MIRNSRHILKFSNCNKIKQLEQLFEDFEIDLKFYIDLILKQKLKLDKNLSSKILPINKIHHSQWRQIVYKQASEIVRSNIEYCLEKRYKRYKKCYKYFVDRNRQLKFLNKHFNELKLKDGIKMCKIDVKNISINIDDRLLSYENFSIHFNEFIGLKLPYFYSDKKRAVQINLPIKWHKQSLKYRSWNRKKTVQLKKINDNFYIIFSYEKEIVNKEKLNTVAFDIGYNKLLVSSNNDVYGLEMKQMYTKLSNMKRGSKNYRQYLIYRNNKINEICNFINFKDISTLILEDLNKVKHKSKYNRKMNSKMQYWSYPSVISKFEMLCEEQGINLQKVSAAYTSQTCSNCGFRHKENRNNEIFLCLRCGMSLDADFNAALNILHRGVYNPSDKENLQILQS